MNNLMIRGDFVKLLETALTFFHAAYVICTYVDINVYINLYICTCAYSEHRPY